MYTFDSVFTEAVLTHSDTACRENICNDCPPEHLESLSRLSRLLGEVQALLPGHPLKMHSAFRCRQLNERVGGVENSQHTLGQAADFSCPDFGTPLQLARLIESSALEFDQLILEFNRWVHISVSKTGQPARREVLSIYSQKQGYLEGLQEQPQ